MVNFGVEGVHYTMAQRRAHAHRRRQEERPAADLPVPGLAPEVISNPGADSVTKDTLAWHGRERKHAYKPVFWNMNITMPQRFATADAAQAVEDTIKDSTTA